MDRCGMRSSIDPCGSLHRKKENRTRTICPKKVAGGASASVLGTAAVFAGCTLLDFLFSGMDAVAMMVNGLVSAGVFFLVFFLVRMASHGGVGYGDIKMITAAALIFGVYGTFSFLLTSHVAAALVAIVLLICKIASRMDGLPFVPFFYLGYLATLLMGTF